MNNNSWFKKEKPMLTLPGLGGGSASNLWKSGDDKTYVDDVFSTFVYTGNGSSQTINNGLDLSGDGGMTWIKSRTNPGTGHYHHLVDTERAKVNGFRPALYSNTNEQQDTYSASNYGGVSSFNSDGFTLSAGNASDDFLNANTIKYSSWSFKKTPGFFDCVTWTGNSTAGRQISHSLGCKPGLIILKCSSVTGEPWYVYHRDLGATKHLKFETVSAATSDEPWNNTEPTSTHFTLAQYNSSNGSGKTYVAYLFAGGESSESGATSVSFDGVTYNQRLDIADTSDLEISNSEFTMECWFRQDTNSGSGSNSHTLLSKWDNDGRKEFIFRITENNSKQCLHWLSSSNGSSNDANLYGNSTITNGAWNHAAVTRDSSGKIRMFLNGLLQESMGTQASTHANSHEFMIGANGSSGVEQYMSGDISNVRFIKGQCLWTSSFRPTNEPLTTTSQGATASNVKLLCCNDSSPTGSTVTPGTITNFNSLTASTDSPFDDPESLKFGTGGDESIVKCGSYYGTGSSTTAPLVHIGWEPQYIFFKNSDTNNDWRCYDYIRGIGNTASTTINDSRLMFNSANAEETGNDKFDLTSTGFKLNLSDPDMNGSGNKIIYFAIRRADGYVGKPASVGTDVFAMDTGDGNPSALPTMSSNFPVDFGTIKYNTASQGWYTGTRQTRSMTTFINDTSQETSNSILKWDSNKGFWESLQSFYCGYMWKRHLGFDVVYYKGNSGGDTSGDSQVIPHSLNAVPEMIWTKGRDGGQGYWGVYHKGLNGGTNPWNYRLLLNENYAESEGSGSNSSWYWNDTAPTATHFSVGEISNTNNNGTSFFALLFASVPGISKVGSFSGSSSSQTITCGFQPRFLIIKNRTNGNSWFVLDTLRGWGSGNDNFLLLDTQSPQDGNYDIGAPTSTGFTLTGGDTNYNNTGYEYVYYAHA